MGNDEAEELGKFRRFIESSELRDLVPILASTLDECVDILRRLAPGGLGTEMAAALSAELHRRNQPRPTYAPVVGNA